MVFCGEGYSSRERMKKSRARSESPASFMATPERKRDFADSRRFADDDSTAACAKAVPRWASEAR
jgi:hypothetical protein